MSIDFSSKNAKKEVAWLFGFEFNCYKPHFLKSSFEVLIVMWGVYSVALFLLGQGCLH